MRAPDENGGVGGGWGGEREGDVAEDVRRGWFGLVGVIGCGGGDFFCYPCCERGGRREKFDGVGDALDWVAVALVDAGEEGGAGGQVGLVARTDGDGCHGLGFVGGCMVLFFGFLALVFWVFRRRSPITLLALVVHRMVINKSGRVMGCDYFGG